MAIVVAALDKRGKVMIQPLRRLHFKLWVALAFILPALFALGVIVR